ncbi:hypothetical protein [Sphingomonas sp. Leaf230]|uniref:hypothetical protein n=1 Tax=Sphingomonas sp. Leaf230 TaxID=1735694 RepID=UPI000A9102E5|nr:hypothetical protein [Sphingomonas sp. Leaf230]
MVNAIEWRDAKQVPKNVWSPLEDAELARRYMTGEPVDSIAVFFSRSAAGVTTRANTLGLRRRKLKADPSNEGNALWVIGAALRSAIPETDQSFAQDLLDQLK